MPCNPILNSLCVHMRNYQIPNGVVGTPNFDGFDTGAVVGIILYFLENENSSRSKLEYQVLLLEALYQHQQNQNLFGFNWRGRRRPDFGVFLRFMEEKGLIKCNSKRYFVIKRGVISSRYFPNTVWLLLGKISNLLLGDSVSVTEKKVRDIVNAIIRKN